MKKINKTWDIHEKKWERGYSELKRYVEQERRLPVQSVLTSDGYKLGSWTTTQKNSYKRGFLSLQRKKRLEAIPYWSFDTHEEKWERGYSELKKYVERERKLPVISILTSDGYKLGAWIASKRTLYTKGKLEADRKELLEAIPYWSWDPIGEQWERGYSELKRYVEQEGKLPIQSTVTHTGYKLGAWIARKRTLYTKGKLEADRKELLEAIPYWSWDPIGEQWERGYSELKKYVERERKLPVKSLLTSDGYKLGAWLERQMNNYKKGKLEADREELLEAIPGWSCGIHEGKWERGYSELKRYVERERKLPVKSILTSDGYKLGAWTKRQRYDYKRRFLSLQRKELLEAIPGWWWRSGTLFYT
ncbi:MAG: helicase associated domain-containing protein [Paraclostridium sp.]